MAKVALIGAGKIGTAIADMLSATGDYAVTLYDRDEASLARAIRPSLRGQSLTVETATALTTALRGNDIVVNAGPYHLAPRIAAAAKEIGAHYFDLTEDVESTRAVRRLAEGAATAFVPQCGLAPGFVSIVANHLADRFDPLHDLIMRVGALPLYPTNALGYNLTWSTEGLINEYLNACEAIVDGRPVEMPALEELEHISLDGLDYEAFNTSGGLGTLCETYAGRLQTLNYKTVRYPGHRDIIKLLVKDLGLGRRREVLKDVLETAIPMTLQDVVLVFVSASGMRDGRLTQESDARKIYAGEIAGAQRSAIQITTSAGICTMVDLMVAGRLPRQGFVRQEQASLPDFLANRFGRVFAGEALVFGGPARALVA
ncbi:MAG: saccharopine dehydrogenase NADP-binding domain-containing protein [Rhodospirillaceae bacterium]|nr:saccharopine dehydrogenase NADP-binding domain-containing protein [Rhodospirillaceae bacterium]